MRAIPRSHPVLAALNQTLWLGLEQTRVIRSGLPAWGDSAKVVGRLLENVEDAWVGTQLILAPINTQDPLPLHDLSRAGKQLHGCKEDLERIHRMLHDLDPQYVLSSEFYLYLTAVEALVHTHNAMGELIKGGTLAAMGASGLSPDEREEMLERISHPTPKIIFGGEVPPELRDFLRRMTGGDLD